MESIRCSNCGSDLCSIKNNYDYGDQSNNYYLKCTNCGATSREVSAFEVNSLANINMVTEADRELIREIKYIKNNFPVVWQLFNTKGAHMVCPETFGYKKKKSKMCGLTTCNECWNISESDGEN